MEAWSALVAVPLWSGADDHPGLVPAPVFPSSPARRDGCGCAWHLADGVAPACLRRGVGRGGRVALLAVALAGAADHDLSAGKRGPGPGHVGGGKLLAFARPRWRRWPRSPRPGSRMALAAVLGVVALVAARGAAGR